jgi:DNA mismatch repair protein MutS
LRAAADTLARLDVVASLAEAAVRGNYIRPTLNESTDLRITGGRHPVVERGLEEAFVPNNTHVDTEKEQILVITGPNMAGKSTVLRQVALIVLMAQIGSFVPAEAAEVGLVDRIFSRIGAQDDIATGRSTFMVEMTETAALLTQSTRKSLIILDEVGRGTSTYDGMAIARAVIEYIHNEPRLQCRTLFATHYHELTDLETLLPRVENYHMAAIEQAGHVVFLYELRKGGADRSYGIHVAELAGIPRPVIHRASELLAELECKEKDSFPAPVNTAQPDEPNAGEEDADKQLSLFDAAPHPVVEYIKRLNINDLTPIEAMTRLYELQKLANTPL